MGAITSWLLTGLFLGFFRRKGWGKSIRTDGPTTHFIKAGTPTMGGTAIVVATIGTWVFFGHKDPDSLALVLLVVVSAIVGLADDIIALQRKSSKGDDQTTGLLARYRLGAQTLIGAGFAIYATARGYGPFEIFILDWLLLTFAVVGAVNAFNMTDGLDGLAGGVTAIILLPFLVTPLAPALLGALLGFLWFNTHPARVFMGGVGSEALGAAIAGIAIVQGAVLYLPLIAIIPVLETLSVITQVAYFRLTQGKRLLKMSPLHHHFELSGWNEQLVVIRFWLVTSICVAVYVWLKGSQL
jgi:phospho-N-acetylmuramoyl-pentapeptide-transferase